MNLFLTLAFLFFIGSVFGWVLELFYRRFISSANPERKWINPGYCTGPYLPLYGSGLCLLYLIASMEDLHLIVDPVLNRLALVLLMGVTMTIIEYIAGICCLKWSNVRLWDYSKEWGNVQGIICPKFSFFWTVLGAAYYLFVHPYILGALQWLSQNLAFSFVIGMFFGVFTLDVAHSAQLVAKMKRFAEENDVIVRYEALKSHIRTAQEQTKERYHFFSPFRSAQPLSEHMNALRDSFEKRRHGKKE